MSKRKNKKHGIENGDEIKVEKISIQEDYYKFLKENLSNDIKNILCIFKKQIENANSLKQQCDALKLFTDILNRTADDPKVIKPLINCLIYIQFVISLKHPLRKHLMKILLNERSPLFKNLIEECIAETTDYHLQTIYSTECNNIENINTLTNSLNTILYNFPLITISLDTEIWTYFEKSLSIYSTKLSNLELSSIDRNTIFNYIHNTTRTLILYLQQIGETTVRRKTNEILNHQMLTLIDCERIRMDTKINCGIIYILLLKQKETLNLEDELKKILHLNNSDIKLLCLSIGILHIMHTVDVPLNSSIYEILNTAILNVIRIAQMNTHELPLLVCSTATILQYTKNIVQSSNTNNVAAPVAAEHQSLYKQFHNVFIKCLHYALALIENSFNCLKSICCNILKNLLSISNNSPENWGIICDRLFEILCNSIVVENFKQQISKVNLIILENIASVCGTECILQNIIYIKEILLNNFLNYSDTISCYEQLMFNDNQKGIQMIYINWIQPLLNLQFTQNRNSNNLFTLHKHFLMKTFKLWPDILKTFILNDISNELIISDEILLFIVWFIRTNYSSAGINDFKWMNDERCQRICCNNSIHYNYEIRLLSLRTIVERKKISDLYTDTDLLQIIQYLKYNLNDSETHQQTITIMNKMLQRFECGLKSMQTESTSIDEQHQMQLKDIYIKFLLQLKTLLENNIFIGGNFNRRLAAITLLYHVLKLIKDSPCIAEESIKNRTSNEIFTIKLFKKLILFNDKFDQTKEYAIEICKLFPNNMNHCLTAIFHDIDLKMIFKQLLIHHDMANVKYGIYLIDTISLIMPNIQQGFKNIPNILWWCNELLENGLNLLESNSIVIASKVYPMYGILNCVRYFLNKLNDDCSGNDDVDDITMDYIINLIKICKQINCKFECIVKNSSPEGYIPMNDDTISIFDDNNRKTQQILLICSWRTIKEISLLFGFLTGSKFLQNDFGYTIIVHDIGEYFFKMLIEAKHRGAVELTYIGFQQLCERLWLTNDDLRLNRLPTQWLTELLSTIKYDVSPIETKFKFNIQNIYDKICVTRRSAGLPFMIQGICLAENKIPSSTSLHSVMNELIGNCLNGKYCCETKTHSLNVLRALFRCSEFSDDIRHYVSDGFKCAIDSYTSNIWSERNSATLLYSALMIRVFGVQRDKDIDTLNTHNKMSSHIFFTHYPALYNYINESLTIAVNSIRIHKRSSNLHPILLFLIRLFPSTNSNVTETSEQQLTINNELNLLQYIEKLKFIAINCIEMKTRQLSAKAIGALQYENIIIKNINQIFDQLIAICTSKEIINQNAIHGYLLQIYYSIRLTTINNNNDNKINLLIKSLDNLKILTNWKWYHFIVIKTFTEILIECFVKYHKYFTVDQLYNLQQSISIILNVPDPNPTKSTYQMRIGPIIINSLIILEFMLSSFLSTEPTNIDQKNLKKIMYHLNNNKNDENQQYIYEYINTNLNILLIILHHNDLNEINENDLNSNEIVFLQFICENRNFPKVLQMLNGRMVNINESTQLLYFIETLFNIIKWTTTTNTNAPNELLLIKSLNILCKLLSIIPNVAIINEMKMYLFDQMETEHNPTSFILNPKMFIIQSEELQIANIKFLQQIYDNEFTFKRIKLNSYLFEYLNLTARSTSNGLRMITATFLCNIIKQNYYFNKNQLEFYEQILQRICSSILLLINDNEIDIRNYISKFLHNQIFVKGINSVNHEQSSSSSSTSATCSTFTEELFLNWLDQQWIRIEKPWIFWKHLLLSQLEMLNCYNNLLDMKSNVIDDEELLFLSSGNVEVFDHQSVDRFTHGEIIVTCKRIYKYLKKSLDQCNDDSDTDKAEFLNIKNKYYYVFEEEEEEAEE